MKNAIATVVLVILWSSVLSFGQSTAGHQNKISIGETVTLNSKYLKREMILDVFLPDKYEVKNIRYPVLFTCQSTFLHVCGITADLSSKRSIPQTIVVSVRNYSADDFIPEKVEGHPNSGNINNFISFFKEEAIPLIDSRYRTQPFRLFYSGSFGGAFSVFTLLTRPDLFNAYLSATPAIDYEGMSNLIMNNVKTYIASNNYENRFLYMAVENDPVLISVLKPFTEILTAANLKGLKWDYKVYLEEDHASIPHRTIYNGLRYTFAQWSKIPDEVVQKGVNEVIEYLSSLDKLYNYKINPSEFATANVVFAFKKNRQNKDIITLLKFVLQINPNSESMWLELGRAYDADNQPELAKTTLEKAYQKAVENTSPFVSIYMDALNKVKQKLSGK